MVDIGVSEDRIESETDKARTTVFQADSWFDSHNFGLTGNRQETVLKMGQQREAQMAGGGGGRGIEGTVPEVLQQHDGRVLAMQNFQNPNSQRMLGNMVVQDPEQRETEARVSAALIAEIKDRLPADVAFAAQGSLEDVKMMVAGLEEGIQVEAGGPEVDTATPGAPRPATPQVNNKLTV